VWDRSRAVGQAYVDFAFAEPAAYGLIFAYTQPHEDAYPELAAANARSRRTMVAYVEDLVRAGQLEGDPDLLGHVYWAACTARWCCRCRASWRPTARASTPSGARGPG
jgi:hypothetical protein